MLLRAITLTLIIAALSFVAVQAQEQNKSQVGTDIGVPGNFSGILVHIATTGALVSNGDGTYTLTLEGVAETTPWLVESPALDAGHDVTRALVSSWAAAPETIEGVGLLEIGDATLTLRLSDPTYDSDLTILSYTVNIADIHTLTGLSMADAPETFDIATLFIILNRPFIEDLREGFSIFRSSIRCKGMSRMTGSYNCGMDAPLR